jgi:hypothetical protein
MAATEARERRRGDDGVWSMLDMEAVTPIGAAGQAARVNAMSSGQVKVSWRAH